MELYDLLHCQTPARLTLVNRPGSELAAYPPPEAVNTWIPPLIGAWPMPEMTKLCSSWDTASCESGNGENRGMLVMLPYRHGARTHARREQGHTPIWEVAWRMARRTEVPSPCFMPKPVGPQITEPDDDRYTSVACLAHPPPVPAWPTSCQHSPMTEPSVSVRALLNV